MKIVHALSEIVLSHGGVVRAVLDLCAALAGAGHEVLLLTFDDRDVPKDWKRGGSLIPRCITLDWPEGAKPLRRLNKADLLRAEGVIVRSQALHLHVPWESTNLQLAAIAQRHRVPYVVSVHGMLDDWTIRQGRTWMKRAYLALRGRRLLNEASAVLCTAEAERAQATKWFSNKHTEVLPLLFDLTPFKAAVDASAAEGLLSRVPGEGPLMLFLSRLHPKKGIEHLLDASAELWKAGLRFRVAIAGSTDHHSVGYDAVLMNHAAVLGIADRVAFLGMVTGTAKTALIAAARAHVLPTNQENWGFAPLESLAMGRPVITTKGVDIWPELERSGGAIITDQAGIASAMRRLIEDEALADEMGRKGREWVLRDLDPSVVVRRYEAFYKAL
ncbi:MAG: glycosyltransferase [Phycisphaerae bacterium]|nr:glycosyltransferase [Phycisphaerae bacterium]